MESAAVGLRERRREATAARLTGVCRRLTAERGLAGFTIEEACAESDVSRRTFFNYFPSKDDAVIGLDEADALDDFERRFHDLGGRGWSAVVDDLLALALEHVRSAGLGAAEHAHLVAAIEREPRLLARFIGIGRERELAITRLVAEREGVDADDPRARAAVQIVVIALRTAGEGLVDPARDHDFENDLRTSIAALRSVLVPTSGKDLP